MWHYVEGVHDWNPLWTNHGIRILPGPSSRWIDARRNRLPRPLYPGFDALGTLAHVAQTGADWSWFILDQKIINREFALSGSEQNPDLTGRSWRRVLGRVFGGAPKPVAAFMRSGVDFMVEARLPDLVHRMNTLTGDDAVDVIAVEHLIREHDQATAEAASSDPQVMAVRAARQYVGDRYFRTATPHTMLGRAAGPLVAVRLNILTRKTLGGIETDLSARALGADGRPVPGLFATGEVAGFGGGGMHGHHALEGSFLGACLFSGRVAGRVASG